MIPSRIVIISDQSSATGGAEALALLSARLFDEAGIPVTFVTGDEGADAPLPASIEVVSLGQKPLMQRSFAKGVRDGLYNSAARRMVERTIARLDAPDVVYHLHGWSQILSPAVFAALSGVESRLVIHAHDFFMSCPNGGFFNFVKNETCHLTPLSQKCLATNCDKRSPAQKAFRVTRAAVRARTFSGRKSPALVAVIHPSMSPFLSKSDLSLERLRTVRNPASAFSESRVAAEKNNDIFFIGRVAREKGVELAAQAVRISGHRLRIIGEGPERETLAKRYPEVAWEGWLSHSEIADIIGTARALVMPSLVPEPFGLVALEALQSGVPLVAFPDSFVAQEASKLGCCFIASERSPESLAEAFAKLGDDVAVREASQRAHIASGALTCSEIEWRDSLLALYAEQLAASADVGGSVPAQAERDAFAT
ncbi:glycosyltransferase family 4 protein [Erythrobacter rubeus]|uniref:Glycosyltransferase family 4 protein n=1 Tax=Erythrobacter rubeus TaxID=2760803 RepID=A0ABR8KP31_9SPHN|nr:glycosyltransferase family 4 protein [Erythrobacter rubeus]MBD2841010.1 glycosyltransferase family 4 protein [Erythrobacter rubeus]